MILFVAATPWEAKPLARRWGLAPVAGGGQGLAYAGRAAGREARLLQTGMGAARTAAALQALEAAGGRRLAAGGPAPAAVASVGLAGALQPGVRPGELVADLRGAPLEWLAAARAAAAELGVALHLGAFHTAERVLGPQEKREAGRRLRAVAVDLESDAVRAWCGRRGAPFAGLRAVFDAVDERVPEAGPEDDSAAAVLRFAAGHWRELPGLVALWPRQARAMATLGRFLDAILSRLT